MSYASRPPAPPPAHDLTDDEFAELDALLAETPEPLEPLDVAMLDGYLCGVIVQPVLLEPPTWLAHVFDFDARPLPEGTDPGWLERVTALIHRRHAALNRALAEDGAFEPLILEPDDDVDEGEAPAGDEDDEGDESAEARRSTEGDGSAGSDSDGDLDGDSDGDLEGGSENDAESDPGFGLGPVSAGADALGRRVPARQRLVPRPGGDERRQRRRRAGPSLPPFAGRDR
jgi:hypothetical protein